MSENKNREPFNITNKTIKELGSLEAALARELHYWLSKLIWLESKLKAEKRGNVISTDEKAQIDSHISNITKLRNNDESPTSHDKLIAMRALVGDITSFLADFE